MTGPQAKFSNVGAWLADAKEKNIQRASCSGRTVIAADELRNGGTGAQRGKGTASRKLTGKPWKIF